MKTLKPREAKQLTVKYVHGGAMAELPVRVLFLALWPSAALDVVSEDRGDSTQARGAA